MRFLETKKIEVGDEVFYIRRTSRAIIEYDALTGRNFWVDFGGGEINTEKLTQLFYTTAKAGARAEGKPFLYTYEEFLDKIDNCPEVVAVFFQLIQDPGTEEEKKK
jgi:hypothetical protein